MRKSIFGFLLALVILVLFPISAQSSENPLTLLSGADYAGNDYRTIKDTTLESCSMVCSADSKCQAFTFNTKANWCFLKSKAEMLMPFSQAVAGSKSTPKSAIGKAKAAELNFLESNVAEAAEEFAIKIRSDLPPDNKDPAAINLQIQTKIAAQDFLKDRKSTRLNSSHLRLSRMPSSA